MAKDPKFKQPVLTSTPFSDGDSGRALALVFLRWQELTSHAFDASRRSRTLSFCGALQETIELADAWVKAQGRTQPTEEPEYAGHGIETLPQVADEALALLHASVVLKHIASNSEIRTRIEEWLTFIKSNHKSLTQPVVERCRALLQLSRGQFIAVAFARLGTLVKSEPRSQEEILSLVEDLIPELRAVGWSDESLNEHVRNLDAQPTHEAALAALASPFNSGPSTYTCWVQVDLGDLSLADDFKGGTFDIIRSSVPGLSLVGPLAKCIVRAFDPLAAARSAHSVATSVIGTIDLFSSKEAILRGSSVAVSRGGPDKADIIDSKSRTTRQRGGHGQQRLIEALGSAVSFARSGADDAAFEAIRHARRAAMIDDDEIRFLVIWLGLERLLQGMNGYATTLESAREVIPKSLALNKMRREIGSMSATIGYVAATLNEESREKVLSGLGDERGKISRSKLLLTLTGPEDSYKSTVAPLYAVDPRLAMWFSRLRKNLGTRGAPLFGTKVASYIEEARRRTEWQVLRLYRARNRVAHAGKGPQWIADLVRHADFYLSQLIGIVTHGDDLASAGDALATRVGCFNAFDTYLRGQHDIEVETLLTPMRLFRSG